MREELVLGLEERVGELLELYQRLQAEHEALRAQMNDLVARQQMAGAKIDALVQKVQSL